MRIPYLARGLWALMLSAVLVSVARAEEPATRPADAAFQSAETRLLRAQVKQLQADLDEARAQIKELKAKLVAVGVRPDLPESATTAPIAEAATGKPKRVVFAASSNANVQLAHDQIRSLIRELTSDQWFNVICSTHSGAQPYTKAMSPALPIHKEKASQALTALQRSFSVSNDSRAVLLASMQFRPEAIYYFGPPVSGATVDEIVKLNRGVGIRIHTTTAFASYMTTKEEFHSLWRLAHETGGLCVDAKGNPIDEPVAAIKVASPPAVPATKPSIFKMNP